ncbi:hypothetical protein S40293_08913 [Stachybotrys chartarum IBT 40293]|nr:hypothetical protein S40293_08913 [Stachybotrys chartarum IBT 40293]
MSTDMDIEMMPRPVLPLGPIAPTPKENDPFLVAFDPSFDPENPRTWSTGRKWAVTDVLSATGFNRIMVSTIMAPALPSIARELSMNPAESVMALSIYLLATAFGPLVMGPLSEMYGREPVLHASNIWFLVWNIACGFANSKHLLIGARFLAGLGASAIYALAGGVLGDVWGPEQRGRSLSIYLLIPLLGPIIGGFMAGRTTWRWMFWATSIFQAVMILVSFTTFKETHPEVILRRRARKLRNESANPRYQTADERLHGNKSLFRSLGRALSRPIRLLMFHPVIQITSIISAFSYGLLYISLSTFSELWTSRYGQSVEISGLHYIACALGEIAGSLLGGKLMDLSFKRQISVREHVPEHRILQTFPGAVVAPFGLLLYGWTAQYQLHWSIVDIGMFLFAFGGQIAAMPLSAYVMDAYPDHTGSAVAATQFLRSLTAFLFPLFAPYMYAALEYGWGNTTLALAGLVIGLPAPLVIWWFGSRLRARASSTY